MMLRSDVRSATALCVDLSLERGPVNDRFRFGLGHFDDASIVALAAFFRAYLDKTDGLAFRCQQVFGCLKVQSEYVRQTERISFSFAARMASISLMNSSVAFCPFSSSFFWSSSVIWLSFFCFLI